MLGATFVPVPGGLKITGATIPSAANDMGLQEGALIYSCNGQPVTTINQLYQAVQVSPPVANKPNLFTLTVGMKGGSWDGPISATVSNTGGAGALAEGTTRAFNVHPSPRAVQPAH